ncbi:MULTISPECIES: DUF2513 domain-containing protein [unclassified Bradyrhizobium]|uniref:DUF2513 domain-containing protein n=1 Tax=Bradyrhizobium sp. USDA 4541 TaxID=2817704 RepID=UPI0020A280A0|nr:DUF2513 domain-containing protein [Bradyrhizobium sp. USDA 4541]MCP1851227.1 DNA-binding transcriptional ArsR family regulator [Bradyrhizobium sp. USDA 4541]
MPGHAPESTFVQVEGLPQTFTISAELLRGIKMQRDMEVIRKVLRAIQQKKDLEVRTLKVGGLDDFTVGYHLMLLRKAGYVDGPDPKITNGMPFVPVRDLTWEGHEFAGAILSDDSTWEKVKAALGPEKLITMPLNVIQAIATKALTDWGLDKLHKIIS